MSSTSILLVSINARYGHCAFAARSLKANLGALRDAAEILETDLDAQPFQLASEIAGRQPRVAGFSVYLWNVRIVRETLAILRQVAPGIRIVLGGPEIVEGCEADWSALADDLVVGEGETAFRGICEYALASSGSVSESVSGSNSMPIPTLVRSPHVIPPPPENLSQLALPYDLYTDIDLAHRTIFVEASRGCPFCCAYCTSCDTGLRLIPLARLLPASAAKRRAESYLESNRAAILAIPGVVKVSIGSVLTSPESGAAELITPACGVVAEALDVRAQAVALDQLIAGASAMRLAARDAAATNMGNLNFFARRALAKQSRRHNEGTRRRAHRAERGGFQEMPTGDLKRGFGWFHKFER